MYFHTGTRASRPLAHFAAPENGWPRTSAQRPPPQLSAGAIACPDRRALRDDRAQSLSPGLPGRAFRNIHPPEKAMSAKPAARIARLRPGLRKRKLPAGSEKFFGREFLETLCRAMLRMRTQIAPPQSILHCCTSRFSVVQLRAACQSEQSETPRPA